MVVTDAEMVFSVEGNERVKSLSNVVTSCITGRDPNFCIFLACKIKNFYVQQSLMRKYLVFHNHRVISWAFKNS